MITEGFGCAMTSEFGKHVCCVLGVAGSIPSISAGVEVLRHCGTLLISDIIRSVDLGIIVVCDLGWGRCCNGIRDILFFCDIVFGMSFATGWE